MNFNQFPIPEAIQHKLEVLEFKAPSPVQKHAILVALSGKRQLVRRLKEVRENHLAKN
tara:strand:- start:475 stop:648 length:174 start_codon:yes stop_codon:yes gene_type:complete